MTDDLIWNLLGHKVQIDLDTGDSRRKETTIGHLMTRDPVSHSLVIAKMRDENNIETIEWIPSCSVISIKPFESEEGSGSSDNRVNAVFDKFFGGEPEESNEESEEDIQKRALKVVNYLKSHHLDVVEKPKGTFIIGQCARFERPYHITNIYCDQPIVLKRITKLLQSID
ncbi:hypothetical protein CRE_03860 [Caenorhabditis remanei]|uniref:AD domain-containing protein n=1 Tax=Caenorhabditis remanei TaxID=31234 RepID=E3LXI6_CAERE|nr:hypothetical protein CRE_03860 [Caenorhabditis remanei]